MLTIARKVLGRGALAAATAVVAISGAGAAQAPASSEAVLIQLLRAGGYVLVMRHAQSPAEPPPPALADPGNTGDERQLDTTGRASARTMGLALRQLGIPIGEVWSSPTYRARQTVLLAGLPAPHLADELGDKGHSMQAAGTDQGAWLRAKADQLPAPDTDTLIVTHQPNMVAAFGSQASGLTDGEALVFRPNPLGPPILIGNIPIGDWPVLAGDPRLR
jgi:phosphohistidine phosphatase SixA